ncbi:hypothetical protein [Alienimonas californiensis]|uniref:Uncharacterized protein n=1 Tax=Alienimonas californiensis TaxID=2527989 RepID=A0A517PCJ0_9PLAN|nr:hypothetical protein [Alienimonas californiensis]QDT17107.1 hypothetical protein CA12_32190 [Alienimonas californiensis]
MLEHIPPPDDRTLRERVDTAMKLSRELDEHLRQTLIPASQRVRRAAEEDVSPAHRRGGGAGTLKVAAEEEEASPQQRDRAVRHAVDVLLEADRFASAKRVRLEQYCRSIRQTMREELAGEPK